MISFFQTSTQNIFAVQSARILEHDNIQKLSWLFGNSQYLNTDNIHGNFIGPRKEMITPWSTNAVEITQNMGIDGIIRIESFQKIDTVEVHFDKMLQLHYTELHQELFTVNTLAQPIIEIDSISQFNQQEGLALNEEEIEYLENLAKKLNRKLTDSEVFGFSQINSEHCRHKIFNGTFIIDGEEKKDSLFKMIRKTSDKNSNSIISAYKDNVAFIDGPTIQNFAPKSPEKPDFYESNEFNSVISLKAETHNFPTTVEPFNGAATGSGGEIRDRMAGGKGSIPLAGTAVYMTPYARLEVMPFDSAQGKPWEKVEKRNWLYQTPLEILIKASNGASDFGNKFGQPLIAGSVFTFEHQENNQILGFDKVIMLAGGVGFGKKEDSLKDKPKLGDLIVILGGDNYRIGMGGASVSSTDTGAMSNQIELNAVQRSNPEMQKRVSNVVRALVESGLNPIVSIHDHGAGGHLNCLSELVEETGGKINIDKLPMGDSTLSYKEILGNESQERMGLIVPKESIEFVKKIAERERAPMYIVGEVTNDHIFQFYSEKTGEKPLNLSLFDMFGSSPKTILDDQTILTQFEEITYDKSSIYEYVNQVLQLESVACKDWLTNKVDRCVTGRVAKQQTCGELQLPLNNVGVAALDYNGKEGIATSIGHAPLSALIDEKAGSKNAIAEALTNIIWAPLKDSLKSVSLSANWMWACKNEGEDARLYKAVEAAAQFAVDLGINIPTGKDSLSMKQKYPNQEVKAPGTVIISAAAHCNEISKVVEPVLTLGANNTIFYINLSEDDYHLGGSGFAQILRKIGTSTPTIQHPQHFKTSFNTIQNLIKEEKITAGHDISSGGLITTLLEMCFSQINIGAEIDLSSIPENDIIKLLFAENNGIVFQTNDPSYIESELNNNNIDYHNIGKAVKSDILSIVKDNDSYQFDIAQHRDIWYKTSYLFDQHQSGKIKAKERFDNYKNQPLNYVFPEKYIQKRKDLKNTEPKIKAAIIREKGSNSEREMAYAMYLAGFEVKDVHMTDLISGRENLKDIQFLAAVGGFSNSDVLGSAKGWAGSFLYNEKAKKALTDFFNRKDTISLGVCNGCQLFIELGLIHPTHQEKPKMLHNDSHKFECQFTSVEILENNSILFKSLSGSKLGIWSAHGEGKFSFPYDENQYQIIGKYGYDAYPSNPNGSDFNTAMVTSDCGRHTVMMPHLERSIFPWNWAFYPENTADEISPWLTAFISANQWFLTNNR
ncbi:MAG: phosphoribosylformylglycinamidine synthase [Flavobacteriaceae bacterium]|nr:phosphoribosylformylglycinamidine synthase [Flavobacteriaceae bacterium]